MAASGSLKKKTTTSSSASAKAAKAVKAAGLKAPRTSKSKGVGKKKGALAQEAKMKLKPRSVAVAEADTETKEKLARRAELKTANASATTHAQRLAEAEAKVDTATVLKASQALLDHVKAHRAEVRARLKKAQLFDDDDEDAETSDQEDPEQASRESSKDFVFVTIGLKRAAVRHKMSRKQHRIPVRNPLGKLGGERTVCLFAKDNTEVEKWLKSTGPIPGLKKIISLKQLRTQYQQFQARRDLAAMYDTFLADDRIVCMLPKALGRSFYGTSKKPWPMRLAQGDHVAGNLAARAERAMSSAYFSFQGAQTSVRAARVRMKPEQVAENVLDVIAGSVVRTPGGWKNIQNIHIKTGNSAALPIYLSTPDFDDELDQEDDDTEKQQESEQVESATATPKKTPKKRKKAEPADEPPADDEQQNDDEQQGDEAPSTPKAPTPAQTRSRTTAKKAKKTKSPKPAAATSIKKRRKTRA